jgi:hypothetical protein
LRRFVFSIRIFDGVVLNARPTKIIHTPKVIRVPPDSQDSPYRLVDGYGRHMIGVNIGIKGIQGLGYGNAAIRVEDGPDDNGVTDHIPFSAHKGLYDTAALNFMVIL